MLKERYSVSISYLSLQFDYIYGIMFMRVSQIVAARLCLGEESPSFVGQGAG